MAFDDCFLQRPGQRCCGLEISYSRQHDLVGPRDYFDGSEVITDS